MAAKKRGLGKGLDALLGTHEDLTKPSSADTLRTLAIDLIQRGQYQPRQDFDSEALNELADSIRAQGVIQPIVVRSMAGKRTYEIIAGERRWRASQIADLHEIPVIIKNVSDQTAMCLALIENIQRQDLNPLEEARALERLIKEFEMTHDATADAVGRSRSAVSNLLRLLELDDSVKKLLETRQLDMGHARALLTLTKDKQLEVANKVVKQGLSVRATESLVQQLSGKDKQDKTKSKAKDPNISILENELSGRLGANVVINHQNSGKGKLQITYNSLDELEGILKRIK
ncbi:MAG TPA: ParB/RepB/Spo0J family partition protein [Thiotrichaceae bacterium]|jgi:ParB family chromosome partitioning protein|nr:ParB/RepB/Spo0J family partition protein [Thiotrichaceae bacterium]HIM07320.1 ParB/RepB/Spo0J family partition protein [Gammaproteobacteria bacterium]